MYGFEVYFDPRLNAPITTARPTLHVMEKLFKNASASEAGDYYQLSFDDDDEKEDDDAESVEGRYFLIQRQFEFPDDDSFYLESDDASFCGHFKVRAATLTREFLSIEFLVDDLDHSQNSLYRRSGLLPRA